ncbi:MAG: PIN domain-containing protein [Armatimonadota bacterium]|nr:PIN domain-containing protein [Armatimonadota bacterium]
MYLLDNDSASLAFNGNRRVRTRIEQTADVDVWLSSIAAEEALRGALAVINWNRDKPGLPNANDFLTRLLRFQGGFQIHPFDERAAVVYVSLTAKIKRVGSQDCRIAASAISRGWIVVTANQKDFSRISGE